jgi:hypothetical protein
MALPAPIFMKRALLWTPPLHNPIQLG